jgi:hypothetical protein
MSCKYFFGLFGILIHGIVYSQPTGFPIGDVSGMFNERGFVKSNSYSYEENEIINDFNGNLQFNFPLANKIRTEYGSVLHEILEAYIGITKNIEYAKSHKEVMEILNQNELAYKYQNVSETTKGKTIYYTRLLIGKDENSLKPFLKYDSEGKISYYQNE